MRNFASKQVLHIILFFASNTRKVTSTLNCNSSSLIMSLHTKCRNSGYFKSKLETVERFNVPDDKVSWGVDWPNYKPVNFTLLGLSSQPWADPEIGSPGFHPNWNKLDGKVDRRSHIGKYELVGNYPRNPSGRTGIVGRGCLGRWGPNHAADPIVTRWKRDSEGVILTNPSSGLPLLQFVAIKRQDCGSWAIPGGMVDPGEVVTITLKREFCEEAMNSLSLTAKERSTLEESVSGLFNQGAVVYKGYVDDPRNTDNAWMETVASNFHDETGEIVGRFPLEAGDDAAQVKWTDCCSDFPLYASHTDLLRQVTLHLKAHF